MDYPWNDRVALARNGWKTDFRISRDGLGPKDDGRVSYGLWAHTWHWQGWVCEVSIQDTGIIDPRREDAATVISTLFARVREACDRAKRDFKNSVPHMDYPWRGEDGRLRLVESKRENDYLKDRPRDKFPTEDIPEGIEVASFGPSDGHIGCAIEAILGGYHYEDSINPYFGRSRYASDCKNREWGFDVRLAKRIHAGKKIAFRPKKFSMQCLSERQAARLIHGAHQGAEELLELYGENGDLAGATSNGLPPGMITLDEWILQEELKKAARANVSSETFP